MNLTVIVIIIGVLIILFGILMQISSKKKQAEFEKELKEKNITVGHVKDPINYGIDNSYIALDLDKQHLIFMNVGMRPELKIIPLMNVKTVELETDGETIYKKTIGTTLTRAVIGGVVFGGLGAVVGAVTGSTEKIEKLRRVTIVTNGSSGANAYLHFVHDTTPKSQKKQQLQLAEKWVRIIENNLS